MFLVQYSIVFIKIKILDKYIVESPNQTKYVIPQKKWYTQN